MLYWPRTGQPGLARRFDGEAAEPVTQTIHWQTGDVEWGRINCPCRPEIRTACVGSMKRQDSAVADPPGTWIDKPGETKESHNADRANDEECCQHDVIVTKRN